jgi:hypothetical protein
MSSTTEIEKTKRGLSLVSYPIFDPFNFMIKRKNDEKKYIYNNDEKK